MGSLLFPRTTRSSINTERLGTVTRRAPKHADWIIAQWPDDLADINSDRISPYPCCSCKKPFQSVRTLRTHKCQPNRKKAEVNG